MKSRVYIETTIPSFYHEIRTEPEMLARKKWTIDWWDNLSSKYEIVTSEAVIDELEKGQFPNKENALRMLDNIPLLEINNAVADIVEAYVKHQLMPVDPTGDALHLALASYYHCDFMLTWNCKHIANANKFSHIRRINGILGLFVPSLVTPLEFIGDLNEK